MELTIDMIEAKLKLTDMTTDGRTTDLQNIKKN